MNLGSNAITQPHTRLLATGNIQFNLDDQFRPANVNFLLDYQPPRQNYPPNQVREDIAPWRYQLRVNGNLCRDQDRQVRQPQRDITKKVKVCKTRENLKNSNFVKNGKTVIYRNCPRKKSGIFLDLG